MKITGNYLKRLYTDQHHSEITFLIKNFKHQQLISELDTTKDYTIEIKAIKSKRSINQNNLMWRLLHELELATKQDMMEWYIHALEDTGAKFEYLMGVENLEKELTKTFRAVKVQGKREYNGKELNIYKCFYGSSKFTVEEMNELLDTVMRYCSEHGIDYE